MTGARRGHRGRARRAGPTPGDRHPPAATRPRRAHPARRRPYPASADAGTPEARITPVTGLSAACAGPA